jgi:hypothetical protein
MINDVKKTGSELIVEEFANNVAVPSIVVDNLKRWLDGPPTNRDLYDALYEQIEVNIRIGDALVLFLSGNREKQGDSIQTLLKRLQTQASNLGQLAKRGALKGFSGAESGPRNGQ